MGLARVTMRRWIVAMTIVAIALSIAIIVQRVKPLKRPTEIGNRDDRNSDVAYDDVYESGYQVASEETLHLKQLKRRYENRARDYWMRNLHYDDVYESSRPLSPEKIRWKEYRTAMRQYNGEMYRKYSRAAEHPSAPVEPDPPPPAEP
jgi:hypothetical protein